MAEINNVVGAKGIPHVAITCYKNWMSFLRHSHYRKEVDIRVRNKSQV